MSHRTDQIAVILILTVALAAAAPLWGPGIVNTRGGGDSPFLLQRLHQMTANLRAGVFPVRWMPDAAYGLGYPFFSYYAALPYYIGGLLALAGLDLLTAVKLTQTLGFLVAALAMYGWIRRRTGSPLAAGLAAVAYTAAPFHMVNVYVRGDSLSEFYAFVFYPLILWALDALPTSRFGVIWAALAYAGLLLTHNISAFIFTPFVLLAVLMRLGRGELRTVLRGLAALVLGMLLAAGFWVPALRESFLVQLGTVTQGYFHYTNHFRALNLVQDRFLFDYSISSGARTPFAMGLVQAVGAALGTLWLILRLFQRELDRSGGFILLGLLLSTLMITPLSKPLWDHLPLLPMVQFPWRFLSVQALFAAAVTAAPFACPPSSLPSRFTFYVLLFTLPLSVLLPLHPDRLPIGPEDVTTERLLLYELFTGNIGTTIRHEYLYRSVVPRPFTSDALVEPDAPPRAIPLDGALLEATLLERAPTRQVWRVVGEGGGIAFPILYWPGWRARIDGAPADVRPVEGSGYIAVDVPPGEHTVVLALGRTPVRAVAEAVSLATALGMLAAMGLSWRGTSPSPRRRRQSPSPSPNGRGRGAGGEGEVPLPTLALLLLFLLLPVLGERVLLRANIPSAGHLDLTMDFIQMPYLHHNPGGVRFESTAGNVWLLWYDISDQTPAPGDVLTVTLKMDGTFPFTATLEMVSPAAVRYDISPLTETSCQCLPLPANLPTRKPANLQTCQLADSLSCLPTVPPDTPRGLYLLRLRVFGPEGEIFARTPSGEPRGTLYLTPIRVPRGPFLPPETPVLAAVGSTIRLYGATVRPIAPDRLEVRLVWSATRPVTANYGISLRLRDAAGRDVVVMDTQPGYGFLPTSLWRPGEMVTDRYELALPPDTPPADGYHVEVVLYSVPTLAEVGRAIIGPFSLPMESPCEKWGEPRQFSLPPLSRLLGVAFGGEIRLAGYDLVREAESLRLTLWWQALTAPRADYTVFVHFFGPESPVPVAQNDAPPRGGAYPTSLWVPGEVVSDTVNLSLRDVPPGEYRLAVGLYRPETGARLPAFAADGTPIPDDRPVLPEVISIP